MDLGNVTQSLQGLGIQAFGLSMPRLSTDWLDQSSAGGDITEHADEMKLSPPDGVNWRSPLDAQIRIVDTATPMPATLIKADGSVEVSAGVLLTLFEQSWIRLGDLYTQALETAPSTSSGSTDTRPEYKKGLPWRQVPKHFFFLGATTFPGATATIRQGIAEAGAPLNFSKDMYVYDIDGLPIDAVAVMAAFLAIMNKYKAVQVPPPGNNSSTTLPIETSLNTLATSTETRLRMVNPDGTPYTNGDTHLQNLTAVTGAANTGQFTISANQGNSSSAQSVTLKSVDATSFPQYKHDRLVFGPVTSGRLTDSFAAPALLSGATLKRDFFTLRVIDLHSYLVGKWPDKTADEACKVQRQASVRINENVTFLADGNDVLAAVSAALPAGSDPGLVVAQNLDGTFTLPIAGSAHWPVWPLTSSVTPDANATLSIDLKSGLTLSASWFAPTAGDATKADVVLQIAGLPVSANNAWLRVYPRKFAPDAIEERGDGKGGKIVNQALGLYLSDPLSLRDPHDPGNAPTLPQNASLLFDMIIVLPNGKSRIYGDLSVKIDTQPVTDPSPPAGSNPAGTTSYYLGVGKAGILGLGTPLQLSTLPNSNKDWALFLKDDANPRNAPHLPTMARRELLAAGKSSSAWSGVIGGGQIAKEAISADARTGEPGGEGGRETIVTGASTKGGILAYDIARHAFRRTTNIVTRMQKLNDSKWDTPTAPTAVEIGGTPTASNGTFAGAVIETIAPACDTPELSALPSNWDLQVLYDTAKTWLKQQLQSSTLLSTISSALDQYTPAEVPDPIEESSAALRLAVEAEHEISNSCFGRRDAQWALQSAIGSASHFIYIETPGFRSTAAADTTGGFTADLIAKLKTQMANRPGLRVVICTSKFSDFAPGYEGFTADEVLDRVVIATQFPPRQAVLFHPIGFPGRFSRVEANVVIVDDRWAMVGGCSFRRRGLTFDGSKDLVVADTLVENGCSPAIRDFRRALMARRLGLGTDSTDATYVALNRASTSFTLVRDTLVAGGLGKIAPVWDGTTPGKPLALPSDAIAANPDGRTFDAASAVLISAIGSALTASGP